MNRKIIQISIVTLLITILSCISVFAYNKKPISNISIKLNNNINVGDYLSDISLSLDSVTGNGVDIYSVLNRKYSLEDAQFVSNKNRPVKVGDVVKIKVKLSPKNEGDTQYYFRGRYNSSNVNVEGGEYSSTTIDGNDIWVYIRLKPIRGSYSTPENLQWIGDKGKLKWDGGTSPSLFYDVVLKKGSSEVARITAFQGRMIDLRGYMKTDNTYTARVRAVVNPNGSDKFASNSSWADSDELYLEKNAGFDYGRDYSQAGPGYNGPGGYINNNQPSTAPINTNAVGWILQNGTWYYRYPNGMFKTNGWEKIGNYWYLFDTSGRMLTGWQQRNGFWYFLNTTGDMVTGWHQEGNNWYYLNTNVNNNEGAMLANTWLQTPNGKRFFMGSNGVMYVGWCNIGNNWYYFYPEDGRLATNTVVDTFYVNQDGIWVH